MSSVPVPEKVTLPSGLVIPASTYASSVISWGLPSSDVPASTITRLPRADPSGKTRRPNPKVDPSNGMPLRVAPSGNRPTPAAVTCVSAAPTTRDADCETAAASAIASIVPTATFLMVVSLISFLLLGMPLDVSVLRRRVVGHFRNRGRRAAGKPESDGVLPFVGFGDVTPVDCVRGPALVREAEGHLPGLLGTRRAGGTGKRNGGPDPGGRSVQMEARA